LNILAERYYVTFGLWHEPSVCRLSVTFLHPRQRLELFGNILHHLIAQGLGQIVLKFWGKYSKGSTGSCKLNTRGYENLAFFNQYFALFRNDTR